MSGPSRAKLIAKLQTALKKNYTLPAASPSRTLLEHVLYASLLEDCPAELAEEGLVKLEQDYFDWNEVRVTTVTEIKQVLSGLPDPTKAAQRLKSNLQGIFEEFYSFDLDHLKKENLGKAVAKFESLPSMTPFVLSYVIQHGLGGHSIPIDYSAMVVMLVTGIASQNEAATGRVPGLERAIPKSKGVEFSQLLHQPAVDLTLDPNDKKARALLDSVQKGASEVLDEYLESKAAAKERVAARKAEERETAKAEAEAAEEEAKLVASQKSDKAPAKKPAKRELTAAEQAVQTAQREARAKKAAARKKTSSKKASKDSSKSSEKKTSEAKATTNKTTSKKSSKKTSGGKENPAAKSSAKKSPAKKPAAKKTAAKKSATKSPTSKANTAQSGSDKTATGKKAANRKLSKRKPR